MAKSSKNHEPLNVVFLADTHLGFDWPRRPRIQTRRRGGDFFTNYQRVLRHAVTSGADIIIHGGDVFNRRRVSPQVVDLCYMALFEAAEKDIQCFLIAGNHDGAQLPVSLFLGHPNIHVLERPTTKSVSIRGVTVAVSGFPFIRRSIRSRIRKVIDDCAWSETEADIRILCMHQAIQGAVVGTHDYVFNFGDDVIRRADIPPVFCSVLAGHIHRSQILHGQGGMPIIYAGSIERTSFAERGEAKGFYDLRVMPTPDGIGRISAINFIELPTRPMDELILDFEEASAPLSDQIASSVVTLDPDAIVSVQGKTTSPNWEEQSSFLKLLRNTLPPTVTIHLGSRLFSENPNSKSR
jgi:DNA repair exonuclease SbcCD nuclease subunit